MKRVVIIGGGFGGLSTAQALDDPSVGVTLLDHHNYHLFQPLLYQIATASLSPGDIASPIRWVLRRQRNVEVLLAEACSIDPDARRVVLDRGSVSYDFLVLAAGATHTYFGHQEWERLAPGLKTLDDALEMRRRILVAFEAAEREEGPDQRRLLTFVIVGGGPTGVELAGALAEIARHTLRHDFRRIRPESARIVLLEGGPEILPTFPPRLRQAARDSLARLGVEVRENAMVMRVDSEGVGWRSTAAGDSGREDRVDAASVLWAAGVAASPLGASLGVPLDRAGRIRVEPTLAIPGHPEVFAIGDICVLEQDGRVLPGVAQVAKQQGAHAAHNILRAIRGQEPRPFRYRDYGSMATIGRGSALADFGRVAVAGFGGWLLWLFVHIFWLIGFRNRISVMIEWAWAFVTFQRSVRLITGERLWPGPEEHG